PPPARAPSRAHATADRPAVPSYSLPPSRQAGAAVCVAVRTLQLGRAERNPAAAFSVRAGSSLPDLHLYSAHSPF
ncbi:hypothetical protein, partial [Streptomyces wadayamensis]|uniref:hypothetical protein n=1 Tax=Streptomyces wadayamensis TaxID=141454 RepID=UPI0019D6B901